MVVASSTEARAFAWHPHADVLLLFFALAAGYVAAVTLLGPRLADPGEPIATARQKALYFTGLAVMFVGAYWPMHDIAEGYLFTVHMLQHMLFSLVGPPLLLLGLPRWLLRRLIAPVKAPLRVLTRPLVAFALFNAWTAVSHWPLLVDASVRSEPLHLAMHLVLVGTALLMWWPVVAPLPEMPSLSTPGKMLYLFGNSILPTVPASFLTFAGGVIYKAYLDAPRLWGIDVLTDQRAAGLLMKLGGGLLLWTIITVLFFRWQGEEERAEAPELSWSDFERELREHDLRR